MCTDTDINVSRRNLFILHINPGIGCDSKYVNKILGMLFSKNQCQLNEMLLSLSVSVAETIDVCSPYYCTKRRGNVYVRHVHKSLSLELKDNKLRRFALLP